MAVGVIIEFSGVDKTKYDAVNNQLGLDPGSGSGDWPKGMVCHTGGTNEAGDIVVTEVWDSKEDQAAFMESRLGPAFGEVGVPQPSRITWFNVHGFHTP
jgi:hypothetical protein